MAEENKSDMTAPKAEAKTVKYKCTCITYWNNILYRVDDVAEVPSTVTPPKEYFEKI